MSELQLALLILGAIALLVVLAVSRRKPAVPSRKDPAPSARDPLKELLEAGGSSAGFDDFGVGKPRKSSSETQPRPAPVRQEPAVSAEPSARVPGFVKAPAKKSAPAKLLTIYVAEREGTKVNGGKIHAALEAQKLSYNEPNKAYDRVVEGRVQFSVTSLTAPGHLDRAQIAGFSTPGLALFLRLPGPAQPVAALRDLLKTADALSQSLKAVLFDGAHQPLTDETRRKLLAEVEEFQQQNP